MISSFRETVVNWLENGLKADIYVSAPSLVSNSNDAIIPYYIRDSIMNMKEVKNINYYSEFKLYQDGRLINILASGFTDPKAKDFRLKGSDNEEINRKFREGEVLVTEPYAYKNKISEGDIIKLKTDEGYKDFKVAGIYYDYTSDKGFVSIEYSVFQRYWKSKGLSGIAVFIKNEGDANTVKDMINSLAGDNVELIIRSNKFLRDSSIQIFDRTFIVAKVLQLLSVVVAFIGILSTLMSLQLERNKETGVLRALGLLPSQLFRISSLQSVLIGLISGLLALPLGALLAYILVFIINKRSFGWTMQLSLEPGIMYEAMILAVVAAVLAGLYPGYRISKISPSAALREE
jgi:putative ABC transport system permease protein